MISGSGLWRISEKGLHFSIKEAKMCDEKSDPQSYVKEKQKQCKQQKQQTSNTTATNNVTRMQFKRIITQIHYKIISDFVAAFMLLVICFVGRLLFCLLVCFVFALCLKRPSDRGTRIVF